MLFLIYLWMACFSQVGFAGENAYPDSQSLDRMDKLSKLAQGSARRDAYAVNLEEEQGRCQRTFIQGVFFVLLGGVGYCLWQEPRLLLSFLFPAVLFGSCHVLHTLFP